MTTEVYQGIECGFIAAAPAICLVIQGRIAVDQAIRILEGKGYIKHLGPKIFMVDSENLKDISRDNILPPADFSSDISVE